MEKKMIKSKILLAGAIGLAAAAISGDVLAHAYPSKPLTFVVPWGAGG